MSDEWFIEEKLLTVDPCYQLSRAFIEADLKPCFDVLVILHNELRHLLRNVRELNVLSIRLGFWNREWQSAIQNKANHPLTRKLQDYNLPDISPAIDSISRLASGPASESVEAFIDKIAPISEWLAGLEAVIDSKLQHRPRHLSSHWFEIIIHGLMDDLPQMSFLQRTPLPLDLLARHSVNPFDLHQQKSQLITLWNDLRAAMPGTTEAVSYSGLYAEILKQRYVQLIKKPARLFDSNIKPQAFRRLFACWKQASRIKKNRLAQLTQFKKIT